MGPSPSGSTDEVTRVTHPDNRKLPPADCSMPQLYPRQMTDDHVQAGFASPRWTVVFILISGHEALGCVGQRKSYVSECFVFSNQDELHLTHNHSSTIVFNVQDVYPVLGRFQP